MRDASIITITLVILFVVVGYMYNLMTPYFVQLGILEESQKSTRVLSDGGVFRSENNGRFWSQDSEVEGIGGGLDKSDVFDIEFVTSESIIYIATSRGLYTMDYGKNEWAQSALNEVLEKDESVLALAIDFENPERMYMVAHSKNGRGRILKSRGPGFYEVYSTIGVEDRILGIWIDLYDRGTIYAGTQKGFFLESKDFGESWKTKNEFQDSITDLDMVPSDTRIMYATVGNSIFKTRNQGKSWENISGELKQRYGEDLIIKQLILDPQNESHMYIASNVGLLRSENGGVSFYKIELPVAGETPSVNAVALDAQVPDTIYIGVASQIYKSDDRGDSWQIKKLNTNRKISVIKIKPEDPSTILLGVVND